MSKPKLDVLFYQIIQTCRLALDLVNCKTMCCEKCIYYLKTAPYGCKVVKAANLLDDILQGGEKDD